MLSAAGVQRSGTPAESKHPYPRTTAAGWGFSLESERQPTKAARAPDNTNFLTAQVSCQNAETSQPQTSEHPMSTILQTAPTVAAPVSTTRIASIDIIRGAVMVLMAIDHVRVFSGVPAGGPTPGVFFTRWVTHFCAPAFIFLAGTSAFLYGEKVRDRGTLARFLFTRAAWLVLLELTVLRFAWTFNFDYAHYALAGVLWAIGWCMILMAGLVYLPLAAVATTGVAIMALHNLFDPYLFQINQAAN